MNNKPIERFNNNEELRTCLKEWQHRLFLDNWHIKAELVKGSDIEGYDGMNDSCWENSTAHIRIVRPEDVANGGEEKTVHEETLVHELLHCVFMTFEGENKTIEAVYWSTKQHQILERMAKSLIMAKYDLDYSYFTEVG